MPAALNALPNLVLPFTPYILVLAKPQYIGSPYWLPPVLAFQSSRNDCAAVLAALLASARMLRTASASYWLMSCATAPAVCVAVNIYSLLCLSLYIQYMSKKGFCQPLKFTKSKTIYLVLYCAK